MIEHGTPAGYAAGCRGIGCANHGSSELMTCEQAQIRFNGDYSYRKQVLAGTATAERERFADEGPVRRRGVELVRMDAVEVMPTPTFDVEAVREEPGQRVAAEALPPVSKPKRRGGRKALPIDHGTDQGYKKGCREKGACPAKLAGGLSCNEAHAVAQAGYVARRREREGLPPATPRGPKPAPVVIPAPTPVVIPEEAWASVEILAEVVELPRREEPGVAHPVLAQLRTENAFLKERVAFLELELDVAKAQIKDEQRRMVALVNELFRDAS